MGHVGVVEEVVMVEVDAARHQYQRRQLISPLRAAP